MRRPRTRPATGAELRVAMIIQGFHPRVGGAERQLQAVAPRLRQRGVDVHVITRRYDGLAPFERVEGIPVHRIAVPGPKPLAAASFVAGTLLRLRRLRPDVVHVHELLSPATAGVLANLLWSTPVVAKVLVSGEIAYVRDERPLGRARLDLFQRRISSFLAISTDIDRELARAGVPADRRRFVPNGVDTDRFAPVRASEREAARRHLGVGTGPTVAYIGRLEPQKNLSTLLQVWDRVRHVCPAAQLLVAGTGSQEPLLRRQAGPGVRFLGSVSQVTNVLAAADAFVLPSWREGLSNALLEAMACGVPVVASAVGGTTEVVTDGVSGLLIDPADAASLERALIDVLSDGRLRQQLGQSARDVILARYALDDRVEELHDLYREVTR